MAEKLVVSDAAIGLWILVLKEPTTVNEQELRKNKDFPELVRLGLVKAKEETNPSFVVDLVDNTARLSALQIEALRILKGRGQTVDDFMAWANLQHIDMPLGFLKKLLDLDIVRRTNPDDGSAPKFVSRVK